MGLSKKAKDVFVMYERLVGKHGEALATECTALYHQISNDEAADLVAEARAEAKGTAGDVIARLAAITRVNADPTVGLKSGRRSDMPETLQRKLSVLLGYLNSPLAVAAHGADLYRRLASFSEADVAKAIEAGVPYVVGITPGKKRPSFDPTQETDADLDEIADHEEAITAFAEEAASFREAIIRLAKSLGVRFGTGADGKDADLDNEPEAEEEAEAEAEAEADDVE